MAPDVMEAAKAALFAEPGITIWQDTVDEVLERGGRAAGVRTDAEADL